jgi:hypothetical protein
MAELHFFDGVHEVGLDEAGNTAENFSKNKKIPGIENGTKKFSGESVSSSTHRPAKKIRVSD